MAAAAVAVEAAGAGVAGAVARPTEPSGVVSTDASPRRPPLLGRSPLRVLFRVAQVSLLLWAVVVLAERYDETTLRPPDAATQAPDLVLGQQVVADDFDGADGPLSDSADWEVVAGDWVTADGEAKLIADPELATPSLALTKLPQADRLVVQARVSGGADGVGLVYGYRSPQDFTRVSFNPSFAAAGVERIDGAGAVALNTFGPVDLAGSFDITLEFGRDEVQVWVGNLTLGQVALEEMPTNVGLSSAGGAAVSFDSVKVYRDGG